LLSRRDTGHGVSEKIRKAKDENIKGAGAIGA